MRFVQRYYWYFAAIGFWLFALWLLWTASPIFDDGYGAVGTLYWSAPHGKPPMAAPGQSTRTLPFLWPYFFSATVITLLCCSAKAAVKRLTDPSSRIIFWSVAACAASLLLGAAISDVGSRLRLWNGPTMILKAEAAKFFLFRLLLPLTLVFTSLIVLGRAVHRKS